MALNTSIVKKEDISFITADHIQTLRETEKFVLQNKLSAEQRLRDHDEFIPFGLFTFLSVIWYLAKYFKPGVFVTILVEKNTVKMM